MAVLSDYLSGTITVTNGSTAFTGTGTAWRVVGFREGDTVQLQGFTAVIAGTSATDPLIESNTAGHFTEPWAGTSGTYAYRMRYLPDGARVTAQTRALIELLGNGVLYSIAELPVQEGMLLIGNASGQYVHIDRSELGIDDPHENLAQLAAIAKSNDQFVVMGADGTITLKSITSVTDVIADNAAAIGEKYTLPVGGTADQLLDATGVAIPKAGLPISDAVHKALDAKASYNWIINGDFTINQRGGVKKPANGVYGFDRWKGHTNGIEQIIEALPAGEYTLTWSGGGTGSFGGQTKASPIKVTVAGGNTSVVVPATATKVSVVAGDSTSSDPFVHSVRSVTIERLLCLRYFYNTDTILSMGQQSSAYVGGSWKFLTEMRSAPTVSFTNGQGTPNTFRTQASGDTVSVAAGGFGASTTEATLDAVLSANTGNWFRFRLHLDSEF